LQRTLTRSDGSHGNRHEILRRSFSMEPCGWSDTLTVCGYGGVRKMLRVFAILYFALLVSLPLQAQASDGGFRLLEAVSAKTSSAQAQQAQSPKEFLESRLGGKVVKLEKDPSDPRRAVLSVERNVSVTQHVLEVSLNAERELQEVRIVTTERETRGIPPVIVMPLSVVSRCWSQCKKKCGEATECRDGCLFDCIGT